MSATRAAIARYSGSCCFAAPWGGPFTTPTAPLAPPPPPPGPGEPGGEPLAERALPLRFQVAQEHRACGTGRTGELGDDGHARLVDDVVVVGLRSRQRHGGAKRREHPPRNPPPVAAHETS